METRYQRTKTVEFCTTSDTKICDSVPFGDKFEE